MKDFLKETNIQGVKGGKLRDLNYFSFDGTMLVFACDSSGSVGQAPSDRFPETPEQSGVAQIKVPLSEMIGCGAEVLAVYMDFCYGETAFHKGFLKGLLGEMRSVGLSESQLSVQYGAPFKAQYSASGATAVGLIKEGAMRAGSSQAGDVVYAVGLPIEKDFHEKQLSVEIVNKIAKLSCIHEILPCGSRGIRYEAGELAATSGLTFREGSNAILRPQAELSCGAAAVVLVTLRKEDVWKLEEVQQPYAVNYFGCLAGEKKKEDDTPNRMDALAKRLSNGDIRLNNGWQIRTKAVLSFARGEKPEDREYCKTDEMIAGMLKEAMEILKKEGFEPFLVINNLSFEKKMLGLEVIRTLSRKLEKMGMEPAFQFTGSTEDNFYTGQTGAALRVFGARKEL